jgi:hypothetical protein
MSIIKFEVKEDHLKLIPFLQFKIEGRTITSGDESQSAFGGGEDLYEEMGNIIFGKPEGEFDPLSTEGPEYSTEQKLYLEELFQQLPTVLDIVLKYGKSLPGTYKRRYHDNNNGWTLLN